MPLKVWKERGRYLVECTDCGSYGTPGVLTIKEQVDPKNAAARAVLLKSANELRVGHEGTLKGILQRARAKQITKQDAVAQVKEEAASHSKKLTDLISSLPDLKEGVTQTVEKCPWCDHVETVVIEELPDGVFEPPEWLAKAKKKKVA